MKTAKATCSLGIIGRGQLAAMISERSPKWGVHAVMLDDVTVAADRVTYESEFATAPQGLILEKSFPQVSVMDLLKDKLKQKRLCDLLQIPTAPWEEVPVGRGGTHGWVTKWATGGYDGGGVLLPDASAIAKERFWQGAASRKISVYQEKFLDGCGELALVGARGKSGHVQFLPLVRTHQRHGTCFQVTPIDDPIGSLALAAQSIWRVIAESLDYEGVMAVEFFQDAKALLVNEIAPRVHNSGHFSQLACQVSQFDWVNQIALGKDPSACRLVTPWWVMQNILAPINCPEVPIPVSSLVIQKNRYPALIGAVGRLMPPFPRAPGQWQFVWYGKDVIRSGRKLGHWNWVGEWSDYPKALKALHKWDNSWHKSFKKIDRNQRGKQDG